MKRWTIPLIGFLVMLGPGAGCAYSLLAQPLITGFAWNMVSGVSPFAAASAFFGIGALFAGFWLERESPRRIALAGIGMWAVGNTLSGLTLIGFGPFWLFFGYGILGGLGCGTAYITALSVVLQWFPEKPGLGSGIATAGFGFGAFAYTLALACLPQYAAVAHMQRRELGITMMEATVASGIVFFAVGVWGLLLEQPPEDDARFIPIGLQTPPRGALRNPQFYIQWTMLFLNATGGIAIIPAAGPVMTELSGQNGSIGAAFYLPPMLALALGCFFWGALSDRIGHRLVFGLLFGLQSVVFFALNSIHDPVGISIALALIFFCYGGGFGTMPAFHSEFFGIERFSANYGIMLTAWGSAGLFAPLFCAAIKDLTGSYSAALQPIGLILLVAIIFPVIGERANRGRRPADATAARPARRLALPLR